MVLTCVGRHSYTKQEPRPGRNQESESDPRILTALGMPESLKGPCAEMVSAAFFADDSGA